MANKKISDLDSIGSGAAGIDVLAIVDVSDGQTKKITLNALIAYILIGGYNVVGEQVSGSGTAWALAHIPYNNTLALYGAGQRLEASTDYALDGAGNITTVNSWPAASLLADYVYTS
jgi:hypothetical protein